MENIVLKGKYHKLMEDLRDAQEYALTQVGTDDGGTCNFDSPMLYLPRWQEKLVEAAADQAGIGCFAYHGYGGKAFVFSVRGVGQGNTRTNAAEAMSNFLRDRGYDAHVYYQMD